ncbi:cell division protein FtsZ [candidate division KSB1 bacterium]|nr:cell division protein FtsZ [candidate division KSB1 bacterium]RQW03701.1 MAG: cell division protein FtsZ [candidate division KSB1 bacterium]
MSLVIDFEDVSRQSAKLKVVGVGGAGGNAINRMIDEGLKGVDFIAINTDEQALNMCKAPFKVQIGTKTTHALGAGADPDKGRRAAEEDRAAIHDALADANMVFITGGMGGGTGTGASPIVAEVSKDIGALTVGIVTTPFKFEGPKRMERAEKGISLFKQTVDTLIVIPNERLLSIVPKETPLNEGFRYAYEILHSATKGISDLITIPGLINLDFADIVTVMSEAGDSLMGTSAASGENRARLAAEQAISSPLLENVSISGARGLLVNICGGPDMTLHDVSEAASIIQAEAGPNANLILGAVIDENISDEMRITVIATGLSASAHRFLHPSLQRPRHDATHFKGVDRREIPAIDRMAEISEDLKNTHAQGYDFHDANVSNFAVLRSRKKEAPAISRQDNGNNHKSVKIIDSLDKLEKSDIKFDGFDSDETNKEDFDIPAVRRRRWNMLS